MFLLDRLRIREFVCFGDITLDPARGRDRSLTIVRAENASGKTTLLRAILWGLYGDDALPRSGNSPFRLQPVDWTSDSEPVTTSVEIGFTTEISSGDGSRRPRQIRGRLVRSVVTEAARGRADGAPDFRRRPETLRLMREDPGTGAWDEWDYSAPQAIQNLAPFDLRSFLAVDAEEAADFVGGVEAKPVDRPEAVRKTTEAVRALLGLNAFRKASQDLKRIEGEFRREANKAVGDEELDRLEDEVGRAEKDLESTVQSLERHRSNLDNLDLQRVRTERELEELLIGAGDPDELVRRKRDLDRRRGDLWSERQQTLDALSGSVASRELFGTLAAHSFGETVAALRPLHDEGKIPMAHLPFVRRLLEDGRCICGAHLTPGSRGRRVVEEEVQDSAAIDRADHLEQVFDFARGVGESVAESPWCEGVETLLARKTGLSEQLDDLDSEGEDLTRRLGRLDNPRIDMARDRLRSIEVQIAQENQGIGLERVNEERGKKELLTLERTLDAARKRAGVGRESRACERLTAAIRNVIDGAYARIQREQVRELSEQMRRLFEGMALNAEEDDSAAGDEGKTSLAMIAEVGVQRKPIRNDPDSFEIYARDIHGRFMPPTEINGASRRILALSFILATCQASGGQTFLVADSLLNFMSGHVRTNALRAMAKYCRQPILLLTPADLQATSERELVRLHAGKTYTLTGQWQHGPKRGDVLNLTDPRRMALLCECGPESHCSVCERRA